MNTERPAYLDAASVNWARPTTGSGTEAEPREPAADDPVVAKTAMQQRVLDTLRACGPLSMRQLNKALDCSDYTAGVLIKQLGDQVQVMGKAKSTRYSLATETAPGMQRASPRRRTGKAATQATPLGEASLFCALANSGELVVRLDDELRMFSRQETLELAAFFKRFDSLLKAG